MMEEKLTIREEVWYEQFDLMQHKLERWKNGLISKSGMRHICRCFYESIGKTKTGWESQQALLKDSKTTDDHAFIPQFIGRMIMDMGDVYLTDFNKYKELCEFACQTIKVTKSENNLLSKQTPTIMDLGDGYTFLECSIQDKYDELGITLWNKELGTFAMDGFPITVPQEILDYEAQFLK